MALKTRITELLGIQHPIVQGGMQAVGTADLASAVSNAGGLGILTALTQPSPEALRAEIERCRAMTDNPFGVNITLLPTTTTQDYAAFAQTVIDSGVKILETAGSPAVRQIWEMVKPHGIKICINAPPCAMPCRLNGQGSILSQSMGLNAQAILVRMISRALF